LDVGDGHGLIAAGEAQVGDEDVEEALQDLQALGLQGGEQVGAHPVATVVGPGAEGQVVTPEIKGRPPRRGTGLAHGQARVVRRQPQSGREGQGLGQFGRADARRGRQ